MQAEGVRISSCLAGAGGLLTFSRPEQERLQNDWHTSCWQRSHQELRPPKKQPIIDDDDSDPGGAQA